MDEVLRNEDLRPGNLKSLFHLKDPTLWIPGRSQVKITQWMDPRGCVEAETVGL